MALPVHLSQHQAQREDLLRLSARIGRNPLLVQASSGNTSIKLDGTMWIKASGTWLAHAAERNTLVPVELSQFRSLIACGEELPSSGASIETAMHAMLPHAVVIHVHSVNTISWAVRTDGEDCLRERLRGFHWRWIPYVASGLPLARAIAAAVAKDPEANIFILANHGLVVCGNDCRAAEELLNAVESRMMVPVRSAPQCDCALSEEVQAAPGLRLPEAPEWHALGTDAVSRRILEGGVLFPCQAMFLGTRVRVVRSVNSQIGDVPEQPPFWVVEGKGIVVDRRMTESQRAVLAGLLSIVQRIDESAPLRYLSEAELVALFQEDVHGYRHATERNAGAGAGR
jgi:rhamnose utilization protein RhaD (predicted bifunctional aldolase and dehydrogenase)